MKRVLLALALTTLAWGLDVSKLEPRGYVNDFAGVLDAQARRRRGAQATKLRLDGVLPPYEYQSHVRIPALEIERGRNRHMGAVIASHAIHGERGVQSPLPLATFFPR